MPHRWLLPLAALLAAAPAGAERADREKPAVIDFDQATTDDLNQVSIFTGKVKLTQGTTVLTGERMEARKDPEGYATAVAVAPPGGLATYRERLDPKTPGVEEVFEAQGERIEYDERSDTVKVVGRARVQTFENGRLKDEATGNTIVYNLLKKVATVDGKPVDGDGRGRIVLPPQTKSPAPASAPPVPLKPAPTTK